MFKRDSSSLAKALLLTVGILQGTSMLPALAQQASTGASQPVFLQGFAEHAEKLAPVEPQLQAGAVFTQQSLPPVQSNNQWYWIPSWYAGQKHVDTETILQDYSFRTGQMQNSNRVVTNRQDLAIGFQADKNGEVWEFNRAPYTTSVEGDKYFTTMYVRKRDPLKVTRDQVVVRLVQTSVNVDKRSRRILKTMQEEQINSYVPAGRGVMNMQSSIKSFNADGSPQIQETSTRVVYDSAPFRPIDVYDGKDMRLLFRDFMLSHRFGNLLPDYLQPPAQVQGQDASAVNAPAQAAPQNYAPAQQSPPQYSLPPAQMQPAAATPVGELAPPEQSMSQQNMPAPAPNFARPNN